MEEDWEHLLFDFSDDANFIIPPNHSQSPLSVDDIEQLLFKDDDLDDQVPCDGFLDDILLDSPLKSSSSSSAEVVDSDHNNEPEPVVDQEEKDNNDPLAKKRKRQLRNRDAAVRSRERKKMHVKDLEMKSRYYEGECRRLGSLLQWYMAENQALRFSLHNAASMTKQESAVLLLESLLLGSLLWLIVVLLPSLLLLPVLQSQSQLVEEKHLPSLLLTTLRKGEGTKTTLSVGKLFKASCSRMRRFLQPTFSSSYYLFFNLFFDFPFWSPPLV